VVICMAAIFVVGRWEYLAMPTPPPAVNHSLTQKADRSTINDSQRSTTAGWRHQRPKAKVACAGGLLAITELMTSVVLTLAEALAGYRRLAR
jgi:hypothetical protein